MLPTLFHIGSIAVPTHGFFLTLGLAVAALIVLAEARRRRRFGSDIVLIVAGALFFGALGAKLSTVWRYWELDPTPSFFEAIAQGGKSILGGLAGAYLGVLLIKRLIGYQGSTGDMFAPAVALGMAIGRVGCFLTEQVGTPTSLPWGIRVGAETAARIPTCPGCGPGVAMHPSFLYEIAFQLLMFGVLWRMRDRLPVAGDLFKLYLLTYAVFRFFVEFVRGNEYLWEGLSGSQLFLIPSTLLLGAYFVKQMSRGAYRGGAAGLTPAAEGGR
ncbi:MAG: prolipoprotein diacylglyceryl transferase family protein [Actinomycetota bacterium]